MSEPPQPPELFRFGVFELDLRARELRKQGRRIRLQDKPFEVLALLAERAGDVVTREELQRRLWAADTHVVFDDGLNTAIRKVRDALGDTAESPRFIETVPRHGYRFLATVVRSVPRDTADGPSVPRPPAAASGPIGRSSRRTRTLVLVGAAAIVLLAVSIAPVLLSHRDPSGGVVQFQMPAPPGTYFPAGNAEAVISPDGRRVAFLAGSPTDRVHRLWVQSLDSSTPHVVAGTEYAFLPAWSPDSRSIAFVSYRKLRTVDLSDGRIRNVCDAPDAGGLTWANSGALVFGTESALATAPVAGGRGDIVSTVDTAAGELRHVWPQVLPGGRRILYLALNRNPDDTALYVARLDDGRRTRILNTRHKAQFVPPDRLLFVRDGSLAMQRFDPDSGRLTGDVDDVAPGVGTIDDNGAASFSISTAGILVYSGRKRPPLRQLVWFDREGRRLMAVGEPDHTVQLSLSPNGRWLAVDRQDPVSRSPSIWVLDLTRGVATRATDRRPNNAGAVWAPDSRRFVYGRQRGFHQVADLYLKDRENLQQDDPLLVEDVSDHPTEWSADGRYILFERADNWGKSDLWVLPLEPPRKPIPWLQTPHTERQARFSPDGRLIAYSSDEGGYSEVYVRTFQPNDRKWQISSGGGARPQWRRDGRELFYISADFRIMSVAAQRGDTFDVGVPTALFDLNRVIAGPFTEAAYGVSADGQRFLVLTSVDDPADPPMTVLLNVAAGPRRAAP